MKRRNIQTGGSWTSLGLGSRWPSSLFFPQHVSHYPCPDSSGRETSFSAQKRGFSCGSELNTSEDQERSFRGNIYLLSLGTRPSALEETERESPVRTLKSNRRGRVGHNRTVQEQGSDPLPGCGLRTNVCHCSCFDSVSRDCSRMRTCCPHASTAALIDAAPQNRPKALCSFRSSGMPFRRVWGVRPVAPSPSG